MSYHDQNTPPRQGAQSRLAEIGNIATPDDGAAWLAVAQDAADAGLIPADRIAHMEGFHALSMVREMQNALSDALAAGCAAGKALRSIEPLFHPGDVIQIKAIDPAGGALSLCGDPSRPEHRTELIKFINTHIGRRNLYFGTNPRRTELGGTTQDAKAPDVVARRTAFVDMDNKDADADADPNWTRTRAELKAEGPVLLVETGNGFHAHFAVEEATDDALAASVGPLADAMAALGSDNVADLTRIARLPWTVNLPKDNKRARGAVPALARPVDLTNPSSAPRPVEALCADLKDVATRLALPGRKSGTGGDCAPASARTGEKTGWAAPSADLLHMAMDEMPNDGPFDDRDDWMRLAHAVKGAAMAGGIEAEGREIWLGWCRRWKDGGDVEEDAAAWDSITGPHTGWGTVMQTLEQHNPAGGERIRLAGVQAAFPPLPASFGLQPVQPFNAASLPPRRWLYGSAYYARYVSMLVAPGGTGKSALTMAEAVAMASGKTLLPGDGPHHALRVWYHNGEDDLDEQRRRLQATLEHHGLTHADLGGRLFLTSGRDLQLTLAAQGRDGIAVNSDAVERLVGEMEKAQIDVLILDPLGAMHTLPENSNEAANLLMGALREMADRSGAAIGLVHHTGKMAAQDMDAAGAGAARGASAFVDGARVVRQLRRAGSKDKGLGVPVPDRWKYVRVDNGKANMAPAGAARWLRLVNVSLNNGTREYPDGDHVQTVETWEPPKGQGSLTGAQAQRIHAAVAAAPAHERRAKASSRDWIGYLIAREMDLDLGPHGVKADERAPDQMLNRADVSAVIEAGLKDGWLVETKEKARDRKEADHIAAGEPPPEPEADPDDTNAD
jgi:hypothetical protein